jgi:NADH-quinone oxidoreductase subunit J
MTVPFLVFFLCALLAIAGSVALILAKEPIHSALSLVLVMMSLAVLYLLLGAPFVAAVQVLVYAGAIMVLFVFVIMLLNAGVEERTNWSKIAPIGLVLGAVILGGLSYWLYHSQPGGIIANGPAGSVSPVDTRELSELLFRQYLFPFEATSILILIAILGALVLAKKDE